MLQVLVGYTLDAGFDVHWLVMSGDPEFFAITKRIHNHLHGDAGDGGGLGAEEMAHYLRVTDANARAIGSIQPRRRRSASRSSDCRHGCTAR